MRIRLVMITAIVLATPATAATPEYSCAPSANGHKLVAIEVFDGPAKDEASLVPDNSNQTVGVWTFAGTYEDGRFITLRCKYADGAVVDIEMKHRVSSCKSREKGTILSVTCR